MLLDMFSQASSDGVEAVPTMLKFTIRELKNQYVMNNSHVDPHDFTTMVVAGTGLKPQKSSQLEKAVFFPQQVFKTQIPVLQYLSPPSPPFP